MKTLDPSFLDTLRLICERLDGLPAPWALTGSLGMRLQGMPLEPRDIDLQSDAEGARQVAARLSEFATRPLEIKESERMRSWFGAFRIGGLEVEIIGDSQKRAPGADWQRPVELPNVIHFAQSEGLRVPVLSLAYEADAYAAMGRAEKAARLADWAAAHPDITELTNYRLIHPNLGTAGMPRPEQLALIAANGYQAVINLALNESPGAIADEAERVAALRMEYVHIPVVWECPTLENLSAFFAALDARREQRVFVHCVMNMRVSAFVYLYRVQRLGHDRARAWQDVEAIWLPEGVWEDFVAPERPASG